MRGRADRRSRQRSGRWTSRARQREIAFGGRGGKRRGAGRKRSGPRRRVRHGRREQIERPLPVHVTMRRAEGLPGLRRKGEYRVLRRAFSAGAKRFGFRLVEYSVMTNHLHLIVEAPDRRALTRGLQGLFIRCARALNRLWGRKGKVFGDRYHEHVLRTPKEVRAALVYVLQNARRHRLAVGDIDPFSSGPWFEGWRREVEIVGAGARWLARARTWLLARGWRRYGRIGVGERAPR